MLIRYVPALKRFIMCVSTPTFSPYTVKQFDTYLLESVNITGPYNLITYMQEFGPEGQWLVFDCITKTINDVLSSFCTAYFVNIPSKFADASTSVINGTTYYHFYLSYSANFAMHAATPMPAGSGYHWTLKETRIKLTTAPEQ